MPYITVALRSVADVKKTWWKIGVSLMRKQYDGKQVNDLSIPNLYKKTF